MERNGFTLYIRADGNERIGTGHIMRCLAIAQAIKRQGGNAVFLVAEEALEPLIGQHGFETVCLKAQWNDLEQELEGLADLIRQEGIPVLLVDSYYVTPRYLETLGQYTKLAYIDDLGLCAAPVDLLIRYGLCPAPAAHKSRSVLCGAPAALKSRSALCGAPADFKSRSVQYPAGKTDRSCPGLLEGCRYVPLQSQFSAVPRRETAGQAARILVLTGGTDPFHAALGIAEYAASAEKYRGLVFDIVCGRYNPDYERLRELAMENQQIAVHRNVTDMAWRMQEADIAITAGGTTVYELCACGTPAVCYVMADNQMPNARALAREGLMLYGGDVRQGHWQEEVFVRLDRLLADAGLRKEMAAGMQQLVDGKGADRIARALWRLPDA